MIADRDHYRRRHGFGGLAMVTWSDKQLAAKHAKQHQDFDLDHDHDEDEEDGT